MSDSKSDYDTRTLKCGRERLARAGVAGFVDATATVQGIKVKIKVKIKSQRQTAAGEGARPTSPPPPSLTPFSMPFILEFCFPENLLFNR